MRKRKLEIDGKGTIFNIVVNGSYCNDGRGDKNISIYPENGKLVVYVVGEKVIHIPIIRGDAQ